MRPLRPEGRAFDIPGDPEMKFLRPAALCGLAVVLAACGKSGGDGATPVPGAASSVGAPVAGAASAPMLLLSAEDLRTVSLAGSAGGPVITGSVQPEKRADLRAEVAAVVTQVLKENGEPVKRGELLMRLDDTSIRESLQSADAGARAAAQAFEQAQRQVERLKTLQAQGMTSAQAITFTNSLPMAAVSPTEALRSLTTPRAGATVRRANSWPRAGASSARSSNCAAPKCARRSTASSASARPRSATRRPSARSW
jgi:membrane fusion protein, multidrug efflux system